MSNHARSRSDRSANGAGGVDIVGDSDSGIGSGSGSGRSTQGSGVSWSYRRDDWGVCHASTIKGV